MTEREKRWDDSDESGNYKHIKFVTNGELRIPLWAWSQILESLRAYHRQLVGLSEHVHEWHFFEESADGAFCVKGCHGRLSREEAECRLNEHPKLQEYATHTPGCHESGAKCICGLDELLAEIEERNK